MESILSADDRRFFEEILAKSEPFLSDKDADLFGMEWGFDENYLDRMAASIAKNALDEDAKARAKEFMDN